MCSIVGCELESYENEDKCILHCEKHEYSVDFHKIGFFNNFYKALINLIASSLASNEIGTKEQIIEYLKDKTNKYEKTAIKLNILKTTLVLNNIYFPQSNDVDSFEYVRILRKLGKIHFNNCEFSISYLELETNKCFFQDCKFHNGLYLSNLNILENSSDVLFQMCEFYNSVTSSVEDGKLTIDNSLFCDCSFTELSFEDTVFKKSIFNNHRTSDNSMEELSFRDCIIESSIKIDYYHIEHIVLNNTIVNAEFEAYKLNTKDFLVNGSQFKGLVNFYNSNFETLFTNKSKFEDMVGFQYCNFKGTSKFENVTFLSFVNMQSTKFLDGLNMSDAYFKEYPNFLGADINAINTNKETFRIIKHSFDKIGNTSEANRYFSYEMAKEMQETIFLKSPAKKTMLFFNMLLSNFGQWYILPLLWLLLLLSFHHLIVSSHIFDNLVILNDVVKNILPIKRFLNEGMEFISLLFYIAYSVLIYHFVIAVKRVTKR